MINEKQERRPEKERKSNNDNEKKRGGKPTTTTTTRKGKEKEERKTKVHQEDSADTDSQTADQIPFLTGLPDSDTILLRFGT